MTPRSRPDTLLVYTKLPVPGRVKTRLAEDTGAEAATAIHAEMVDATLREAATLHAIDRVRVEVRTDCAPAAARAAFGSRRGIAYRPQGEGDLGARLERGVRAAFGSGSGRVCAIGTDCPDLDAAVLREAFAALSSHDVVLGPASDGGYYLIGVRKEREDLLATLFREMAWSTPEVAAVTRERARAAGATVALLPVLSDVDTGADLLHLERVRASRTGPVRTISVVIAARNEEASIERTLGRVTGLDGVDVLLADGGSTDATVDIARARGVPVLTSAGGRAAQLAAGAERATGDTLLFLHADTLLPEGWPDEVRRILADPQVALGAFSFATDSARATLRGFEHGTNARARLGLPYGDQAHFLRRGWYRSLGGIDAMPLMEDYELARRARRAGRVTISPLRAVTSARRWEEHGPWRWTLLNMATAARYEMGVSAEELVAWRRRMLGGRTRGAAHSKR